MKAVGYARVSGLGQVEGTGLDRQQDAIQACCERKGIEFLRLYREEGVSGKLGEEDRPAFQQMVSDLLGNGCRTVIVESLDRIARQYDIQQQLVTYLASKGIALIAANTDEDITAALMGDPMRRALVQIQGIFSELDKNLLTAKLRKARERIKHEKGRCAGRKPFGTRPGEGVILERIADMRRHGHTLQQIAYTLNAEGHQPRMGGKWKVGSIARILSR